METKYPNKTPLTIYPEGSTQNNTHLAPFKRGSFSAETTTLIPVVMKYQCSLFLPFNEVFSDLQCIILTSCNFVPVYMETTVMPAFQPNDYLYETHTKQFPEKLQAKWHVYSWAVREAMSVQSGLPCIDQDQREHILYWKFLIGKAKSYNI